MISSARQKSPSCLSAADPATPGSTRWRGLPALSWLVYACAVLLAAYALTMLARGQLRQHLIERTANQLGPVLHGGTPYQWSLDSPQDVVARHAFGAARTTFSSNGVELQADNEVMELGLVIARALDLRRFHRLQVRLTAEDPLQLAVVIAAQLGHPTCLSGTTPIAAGTADIALDLSRLGWRCDGTEAAMPTRAAMLRLRLQLPPGQRVEVADVRLLPSVALTESMLQQLPSARADSEAAKGQHAASDWSVIATDLHARPEKILARSDAIHAEDAGALVLGANDWPAAAAQIRDWTPAVATVPRGPWLDASILATYAALLLLLRLRPPVRPRLRALLELSGVLVGPLWWVIGGYYRDGSDPQTLVMGAITLVFAASLLIGTAPRQPTVAALRRGGLVAALSVLLAVLFVSLVHDPAYSGQEPSVATAVRYLLWAGIQQFLICVIVAERLQRLLGSARWATLGAACLFALLHTPNETLMLFTLAGGLIWVWNWQQNRTLLPNILAHAICGLLLSSQLPPEWLRSAEVSARYFF